jgi:hypothetical protein
MSAARFRLAAAVLVLAGAAWASAQGRLRPPAFVTCDRNHLTAFTGRVTRLQRADETTSLKMETDDATHESFTLHHARGEAQRGFFFGGKPFTEADWSEIATADGVKPGARATVWVCQDQPNPIVDWERSHRD